MASRSFAAAHPAEDRPDQVAAAGKAARAEADQRGRRERQDLRPVQIHQGRLDRRALGSQLGSMQQAQGDQLGHGDRIRNERMRNHEGIGRMQANRRVEIQEPAKHGRRGQHLALGRLDIGLAAGQLGGRSIGVSLAALPGLGIIGGEFCDHACFLACLQLGRAAGLGAQQLAVGPGHSQKYLVTHRDGLRIRAGGRSAWPPGRRKSPADVLGEKHARNVDRARRDRVGSRADVNGRSIDREDVAVGLLQIAGMRVVVHAGIDGGQEIGGRELPKRGRLEDARACDIEIGVLHARQIERGRQVDRLDFGLQDRGRRGRG